MLSCFIGGTMHVYMCDSIDLVIAWLYLNAPVVSGRYANFIPCGNTEAS
jgi:hypothetical protein